MKEKSNFTGNNKMKKRILIAGICLAAALVLCAVLLYIIDRLQSESMEFEPYPPLDPLKLYETKPEGFDIMEYAEYLSLDRSITLYDPRSGVTQSVSENEVHLHGKAFEALYAVILSIRDGDFDEYNSYMGNASLKKDEFTQQQIYDIQIVMQESTRGEGGAYEMFTYKVLYKIHENNGTYRNNIESDASRAQYFILDNKKGEFTVSDIQEQGLRK